MAAKAAFEVSKEALAAGAAGTASAGTSSAFLSGINWSDQEAFSRYESWASNWGANKFIPSYQNTGLVSGIGHVFLAGLGIPTEANYLDYLNGNFDKIIGYSGGAQTVASAGAMGKVTAKTAYLVAPQFLMTDPHSLVESGAFQHVVKYQSLMDPFSMFNLEIYGSNTGREGVFIGLSVKLGGSRGVTFRTKMNVKHGEWRNASP
jgi:hypothetical protein